MNEIVSSYDNTITVNERIDQAMSSAGVQRALQIVSDKMARADELIKSAHGAGLDMQRGTSVKFIQETNGTQIVDVSYTETVSLEPRAKGWFG